MSKRYLALDIGAANVALAEYELGSGDALTLVNYGIAPLAAPLDSGNTETILAPALLEIVREKGIKPGDVALSISGQMVFPRFASIAAAGGEDKFEQMIRLEIEQNVPFPIDEMVCDHQVTGETETGEQAVLIVASKLDQVEAIVAATESAGFKPTIVDVAPIAITNVIKAAGEDQGECVVLLDIGAKTTSLVIVEGDKLYNRSIPIAGANITRDIAQALGCSLEEAETLKCTEGYVALGGAVEDEDERRDKISKCCRAVLSRLQAEISRSVNFYQSQQGGSKPVRLYLTGGSALLPQIDTFFADQLGIEVRRFEASGWITCGERVDAANYEGDSAILTATVGLVLHAAAKSHYAINLIPPSVLAARAEKARVPVIAVAGVLFLLALGGLFVSVKHQNEVTTTTLDSVGVKLNELKSFDRAIKTAQGEVDLAAAEAEKLRKLMVSRSAAVSALAAVSGALEKGMWIEKWEPGKVTIRGWSHRLEEIVAIDAKLNGGKRRTASEIVTAKLRGSSAIDPDSVKISNMTTIGRNDEVQQFTVELKFK